MKIIRRLFGQRRWLAWLPLPAAALLSGGSLGGFFDTLLGGCIWWVPYWLAWWLSDGFATVRIGSGPTDDDFGTGYRWGSQGYGYYQGSHRVH